jgi:hypothetical protein
MTINNGQPKDTGWSQDTEERQTKQKRYNRENQKDEQITRTLPTNRR